MALILGGICVSVLCLSTVIWIKRTTGRREMEPHSITADGLHTLLATNHEVLLFDVRQPLDLLANAEMIPGAKRFPPKEVLRTRRSSPKERDSIVYCTCPNDKTSRTVLRRALALHFLRIKFLKGGLAAWKAKGYPLEPYKESFRL